MSTSSSLPDDETAALSDPDDFVIDPDDIDPDDIEDDDCNDDEEEEEEEMEEAEEDWATLPAIEADL